MHRAIFYIKFIKSLLSPIKGHILLSLQRARWREHNIHNATNVNTLFPLDKVSVGRFTYGALNIFAYGNPDETLSIGHFCSIANDVRFILGGGHNYNRVTTFPLPDVQYKICCDAFTKGPIIISDDVWIGRGATIMPGVKLGQGCVIGANETIKKDIPPYAIYAEGKILKYRFSSEMIDKLVKLDFSKIGETQISAYKPFCQSELTDQNIDVILKTLQG